MVKEVNLDGWSEWYSRSKTFNLEFKVIFKTYLKIACRFELILITFLNTFLFDFHKDYPLTIVWESNSNPAVVLNRYSYLFLDKTHG